MAQNRKVEQQSIHSSSGEEEEEEASSEEVSGSGSESEAEEEPEKTSPPTPPATKKPSASKNIPAPADSFSDESGSESESEPDLPPSKKADPNIKPIATKPMDSPTKATKKPRSKLTGPTSPTKSAAGNKRPLPESEGKDSKRARKKIASDGGDNGAAGAKKTNGDDTKKQLFQRIWSEDDEIVVLKGLIDYAENKGADPLADLPDFHNFIKKSLHVDVSNAQLLDKVRRLKKKYGNLANKGQTGKKEKTFSKAHDQEGYELSKKIWGSGLVGSSAGASNSTKVNGTPRKNQSQRKQKAGVLLGGNGADVQKEVSAMEVEGNEGPSWSVQLGRGFGATIPGEEILQDKLKFIAGPKRAEMEEKMKKLHVQEIELFLKKVELVKEQGNLILEALKSSGK